MNLHRSESLSEDHFSYTIFNVSLKTLVRYFLSRGKEEPETDRESLVSKIPFRYGTSVSSSGYLSRCPVPCRRRTVVGPPEHSVRSVSRTFT